MHMQIDESRRYDQPARIEFLIRGAARFTRRRDLRNLPIAQQDVHGSADPRGRIDEVATFDQQAVIFFTWPPLINKL